MSFYKNLLGGAVGIEDEVDAWTEAGGEATVECPDSFYCAVMGCGGNIINAGGDASGSRDGEYAEHPVAPLVKLTLRQESHGPDRLRTVDLEHVYRR